MGRKSHYVQSINHKDIDFLNSLRCSGICTKSQATQFISANRLKNFVLDRTLEKCSFVTKDGQRQEVYRISKQGEKFIERQIAQIPNHYYRSTGHEHDLKLMDKILTLSREERQTMRCESEIRDEFKERLQAYLEQGDTERYNQLYEAMFITHSVSMPDLAYGVNEYYEVITSSYGEPEIAAKIEAVDMVGGNLTMERI